jgi:hypothetical protein
LHPLESAAFARRTPNSEVVASIDHLIGASNQRRWYFEAERPGGLQINDQLEFGGLIERDVARFGPAQDLWCTSPGASIAANQI